MLALPSRRRFRKVPARSRPEARRSAPTLAPVRTKYHPVRRPCRSETNMSEPGRQIVLASRPKGLPTPENFCLEEVQMPQLPLGGLLLRVLYLSLDPYMRGRMDDRKSYAT